MGNTHEVWGTRLQDTRIHMRLPFRFSKLRHIIVVLGLLLGTSLMAAPAMRVPNTTLRLPSEPPPEGYGVSNALNGLRFENPIAITSPPGDTNRLFVVERTGRIMVVTNLASPDKTLFLDLRTNLSAAYLEAGLLGLAFHPGHATNRQFFVFRTLVTSTKGNENTLHDELSRFESDPLNPHRGLPESETRILSQVDDRNTHNGGDLHFGPDGYLYISMGDEGPVPARRTPLTKQPIDRELFSGILRIDIDKRPGSLPPNPHPAVTEHYAIPPDNPFVGVTQYQGVMVDPAEVRTELYAVGFRNPWRMGFDPVTGELYVGDVGNSTDEEVNRIKAGGNYGWPYKEGLIESAYYPQRPSGFFSLPPFLVYRHGNRVNEGNCVIGGRVYRGSLLPDLQEHYLFADLTRGHIWAATIHQTQWPASFRRLTADPGIVAFGYDPRNQEILVVNYREGIIRHVVHNPPGQSVSLPLSLADTGAFEDLATLTPHKGIVAYDINLPFWSDHAIKTRWFSLPDPDRKIGFHPTDNWQFPTGTVWIKHFELEMTNGIPESRRRIETRFLTQGTNGVHGLTYRWDDLQTNAYLVPEPGLDETFLVQGPDGVRPQVWHYPGRVECRSCHTRVAGDALGFNTVQMNRLRERSGKKENQLVTLSKAGYFENPIEETWPLRFLSSIQNQTVPLQDRVRGYLQANCSPCHQPGGLPDTTVYWDARLATPLSETRILDNRIVRPHVLPQSGMHVRVSMPGPIHMPPLATSVLDTNAIEMLREWITTMPIAPWTHEDIGAPEREGSTAMSSNVVSLAGGGAHFALGSDQFHFLHRPMSGNGHLVARLRGQQRTGPEARAGLMFRTSTESDAPFAMISLLANGGSVLDWRDSAGRQAERIDSVAGAEGDWLRLVLEDGVMTGFVSPDGLSDWTWLGSQLVPLGTSPRVGLASTAGHTNAVNLARFEQVSMMSVTLLTGSSLSERTAPATITTEAVIQASGRPVQSVRFFADGALLAERFEPPFSFTWSNAPAGNHSLHAEALDDRGLSVHSQQVPTTVLLPASLGVIHPPPLPGGGDWKSKLGSEGYLIVNDHTNLPPDVLLAMTPPNAVTWELPSSSPRALERALEPGRIASAWTREGELDMDLVFSDGHLHRLTVYLLDWDTHNKTAERIDLLDGTTGRLIAGRKVDGFSAGSYVSWTVRGHVKLRLRPLNGNQVFISGLFVDPDPNRPPEVALVSPASDATFETPLDMVLKAEAVDPDGGLDRVEFLNNDDIVGVVTAAPYEWAWTNVMAGDYVLQARAVDHLGESRVSERVTLRVGQHPPEARFIRTDRGTRGDWQGVYGREGLALPGTTTNLPGFAQLTTTAGTHVWDMGDLDSRALQHPNGNGRIASTWIHGGNESFYFIHLDLLDGQPHQVALYLLDWDSGARQESVSVWNHDLTQRFIENSFSNYHDGLYGLWQVRGSVSFQIKRLQGSAVVSGLFIDPPASEFLAWSLDHFNAEERSLPYVSGPDADPDLDLLPNLMEYALGLDPRLFNGRTGFESRVEKDFLTGQNRFIVEFPRRRQPTTLRYVIEASDSFFDWKAANDRFVLVGQPTSVMDGAMERVRYRLQGGMNQQPRSFFRLRVDSLDATPAP